MNMQDGTQNILSWECVVPGKEGTIWATARVPLTMTFTDDYPSKPPVCKFNLIPSTGADIFQEGMRVGGGGEMARACESYE